MSVDEKLIQHTALTAPGPDTPPAVRVDDLHKTFRIPLQRVDSFKERAVHPFAAREHRELRALDGISFEIRKGEFFGIVGRNGSGKSTLLKLLASIYRADSGVIQIAGRMAPFIELGVGFNLELTARENVILNGVMMGLTPKEVRRRIDSVIEFAELQEFVDLKLKNYSSGMLVRLAFSVMMEADADVLLIDEVLAVGDASFQQKCADAFHRMKAEGKTIVLVTHEMGAVEAYCHRAMLLSDGVIQYIGDPVETGREYMKLNFARSGLGSEGPEVHGEGAKVLHCRVEDENGEEMMNLEHGEPIRLRTELELLQTVPGLYVGVVVTNAEGLGLFEFGTPVSSEDGELSPGKRITITNIIENPLATGRHYVNLGIQSTNGISIYGENAASFVIYGSQQTKGLIAPKQKAKTIVEDAT